MRVELSSLVENAGVLLPTNFQTSPESYALRQCYEFDSTENDSPEHLIIICRAVAVDMIMCFDNGLR